MNKEQYIKLKNGDMTVLKDIYTFYLNADHKGQKLGYQLFNQYFLLYLEQYWYAFDSMYNVLKLEQQDGHVIYS